MTKKLEWWAPGGGHYDAHYLAEYADRLSDTIGEVDGLEKLLNLRSGARVLDMPCGWGRHALELAKRGCVVTGVDLHPGYLERARQEAVNASVSLSLHELDMREVRFTSDFDAAYTLMTSIGIFENDRDDACVLGNIARALKSGGLYALDYMNAIGRVRHFVEDEERWLSNGSHLRLRRTFDLVRGTSIIIRTITANDGSVHESVLTARMYTVPELKAMAKEAGLMLKEVYADFNKSPLTMDSSRVLLIFEKR